MAATYTFDVFSSLDGYAVRLSPPDSAAEAVRESEAADS
jgi:hypothetical protein